MKKAHAAAIYARISSDQSGEGLGVQRQLEDCRRLATDRGWAVAGEYVDNDVSAYSGKTCPNYERMVADIAAGQVDAVLVYHLDRLTRRPVELERFIEVCTSASVDVTTVTGDVGLGNDNGLMVARITSAMAAAESGRKSARIKRKMLQNAQQGKPNGGAQRPFGFEPDKITIRETEAEIIRSLVTRYIGGESMNSLALWLNRESIPTSGTAEAWSLQTLRLILTGGRIAGIRVHHGQPVAPAVWDAIITAEQHEQVLAVYEARKRPNRRPPQRYLLSGMLRCGRCGATLISSSRQEVRRYSCPTVPGNRGCGKLSINGFHAEQWAAAAIRARLDSPEMTTALVHRAAADARHAPPVADLVRAQDALTELAVMLGAGELTRTEYTAARKAANSRRSTALRALLAAVDGAGYDTAFEEDAARAEAWSRLPLERQREIARQVMSFTTVQPRSRGIRRLDPSRMEPTWVA